MFTLSLISVFVYTESDKHTVGLISVFMLSPMSVFTMSLISFTDEANDAQ